MIPIPIQSATALNSLRVQNCSACRRHLPIVKTISCNPIQNPMQHEKKVLYLRIHNPNRHLHFSFHNPSSNPTPIPTQPKWLAEPEIQKVNAHSFQVKAKQANAHWLVSSRAQTDGRTPNHPIKRPISVSLGRVSFEFRVWTLEKQAREGAAREREGGGEGEGKGKRASVTWYGLAAGVAVADPAPAPAMPRPGKAAVISPAPTPCLSIARSTTSLSLSVEFASPLWSSGAVSSAPPLWPCLSLSRRSWLSARLLRLLCFVSSDGYNGQRTQCWTAGVPAVRSPLSNSCQLWAKHCGGERTAPYGRCGCRLTATPGFGDVGRRGGCCTASTSTCLLPSVNSRIRS